MINPPQYQGIHINQRTDLTEYGKHIMNQLEVGMTERVTASLAELDPELPKLITDYAFGSVVGRAGLDLKTREMLTVASLISFGNARPQLELHMRLAMNVGVTSKELLEIIIQMGVYVGIPACMNGLSAYRTVLKSKSNNV